MGWLDVLENMTLGRLGIVDARFCEVEHDFGWVCVYLGMSGGCMLVGIAIGLWIWQVFLGYLAGPIDFTINSRHREMGCVYTLAVYSVS